ncbi:MAG: hypothetical protein OXM61_25260 [Candidatus Poribacteria bacterium]|nr:hypothetical protein [Candidatus Poribacteria bacterium]
MGLTFLIHLRPAECPKGIHSVDFGRQVYSMKSPDLYLNILTSGLYATPFAPLGLYLSINGFLYTFRLSEALVNHISAPAECH